MAVSVKRYEGGQVARPQQPVGVAAAQSGMGEVSRGVAAIGDMFYGFQDEVDTADAKVADSQYAKIVQDALYADQTGFMYTDGANATARRQTMIEQLEKERERMLGGLSAPARARAESAMTARMRDAAESVNRHAVGQGKAYLNSASEARIDMFMSDAVYKPESSSIELKRAEQEINDLAARNGWSPEVRELKLRETKTQVHFGIAQRIANADAGAALDYLSRFKGEMDGQAVAKMEGQLAPMVKEQRGRRAGAAAASGLGIPKYEYSTQVDYQMGPARPNKPDQAVVDVIGKSVEDVLGPGARVIITSGQENDGHQHGSGRHKTGLSADVKIIRADGSVVKATDVEMAAIGKAAAANGALGIGFGANYMGGEHAHIDLVDPKTVGGAHTWEDAKSIDADIRQAIASRKSSAAGGVEAILGIADPLERQAALSEYNLRKGIKDKQTQAMQDAAQSRAFQIIEAGGSLGQLTFDERVAIGQEGMASLMTYEAGKARGVVIKTDDEKFVELMDLRGKDPQGFAAINPLTYRNQLSNEDFQSMVSARTKIQEGEAPSRDPMKIGEARSAIETVLDAAGVDTRKAAGAKTKARMEAAMLRWHQSFVADAKRAPTALEIHKRASDLMVPVVLNPPGAFNEQTGAAISINLDGKPVSGDGAITLDALQQSSIKIGGTDVAPADVEMFIEGWMVRYGSPPTPRDVLDGLIGSGRYLAQ